MDKDKQIILELKRIGGFELGIPEEYKENPILLLLLSIREDTDKLVKDFEPVEDYLPIEGVVNYSNPQYYDIETQLGRPSHAGYITNDGTDDIKVSINGVSAFTLKPDETFSWGRNKNNLIVKTIKVSTSSSTDQYFRILAL